jgi:toxin ParE1/3/4
MLLNCCQELADKVVSGKNYHHIHEEISGFKTGRHIIFYRKMKGSKIEIVRILHNRMDLKNRLQE